ncbi:MAG: DUF3575 domain-containing protein [Bacteroidales bacterium]
MKYLKLTAVVLLIFQSLNSELKSQEQKDSSRNFKNTIRLNITNPMFFGEKNIILGFERVLKNNQTITANIGRIAFPKWEPFNTDSLSLQKSYSDKGFGIALDYRFYLKKENKYAAPRGVYIGPYYSYNHFSRQNNWSISGESGTEQITTDISMNLNLVGVQFGYQFVFWDRLSLDMVLIGPGMWFYNINTSISTNLTDEQEKMLFEKINEAIDTKIPGNTINLQPFELSSKGKVSSSSAGYRYVIHIGFRF